ncbi:signal peptidase I [Chloroflexota bacterium]
MRTVLREFILTIILALVIFLAARAAIQTYVVVMTSMEPNFHEGNRVVVNKAVYWLGEPERGDVIVFEEPNGQKEDFIKRVIALPGDTVEIKDKDVYINGTEIEEPYIRSAPNYYLEELEVPENNYFVLGDNRNNSNDSHRGWFVKGEKIYGKAWLITWPPNDWGIIPSYDLAKQLAASEA